MEIARNEQPSFLAEVFDVKMTGLELSLIHAVVSQTNTSDNVGDVERCDNIVNKEEIIEAIHKCDPAFDIYLTISALLKELNLKGEY